MGKRILRQLHLMRRLFVDNVEIFENETLNITPTVTILPQEHNLQTCETHIYKD